MRGRLDEILDYLENTDVEVTLVMHEDKTFSMTMDYTGIVSAVKEAVTAYLTDRLNSMGITLEQYEEIAGISLKAMIEEFLQKMDSDGLSQIVTGTYTENRGSLVFTAREFNSKGSWEGDRLSLNAGALGELVLTRKP